MAVLSWQGREQAINSSVALTVRAQTLPLNDNGRGGQLLYDAFFPIVPADSIRLRTLLTTDFRPVADRREWNAPGRLIHVVMPKITELELVPVESYFPLDEYEMQLLFEAANGNQQVMRDQIGVTVPQRTDGLALANNRRLEVDAFTAWALGQLTARNPQTGTTQTVSFGFDTARYTTAGTAWNAVANAYSAFMTWYQAALDLTGPGEGVMLRQATLNEILLDAPPLLGLANVVPTLRDTTQRIRDELGQPFNFVVNENQEDIYTGAGLTTARTKIWPTGRVAVIPAGGRVGDTKLVPSVRAGDLIAAAPQGKINVRGQTAYVIPDNGGKGARVEAQILALSVPNEQLIAAINAGV